MEKKKNLRCILLISLQCRKEKSSEKVNQQPEAQVEAPFSELQVLFHPENQNNVF